MSSLISLTNGHNRKEPTILVLSRYKGESIRIDDEIIVTVVEIRGDKVRIGIDAPGEVRVHRQEVYEKIMEDKDDDKVE